MNRLLDNMRLFTILFAISMPELLPNNLIAAIKVFLFLWIGIVGIREIIQAEKSRKNILIWAVLGCLVLVCLYDMAINLIKGGEMRWTMLLGTSLIAILYFEFVRLKKDLKLIELFTEVCNLWVIISFGEVLFLKINHLLVHNMEISLCGYTNGLGAYIPPVLILNLFFLSKKKKNILLILGSLTGIAQVVMVESITSFMAVLMVLFYFWIIRNRYLSRITSPAVILSVSIAVFFVFVIFRVYQNPITEYLFVNIFHRDMTLSLRTDVWDKALKYIQGSLLFGHGSDTVTQKELFSVPNCHNYYLDILSRSGIAGLILIFFDYIIDILFVYRKGNRDSRILLGAYFVLLVPWQFESYCNYYGYPLFYMILLFSLCISDIEEGKPAINPYCEEENNYFVFKRILDIFFSLCGIILTVPVAVVVFIVKKIKKENTSLLYKQTRIGKDGKPFTIYKFQTMIEKADENLDELLKNSQNKEEWEKGQKLFNDTRITPIGKVLRKYSIDELPQFFNVFKGDMSIIGPRPLIQNELEIHGGDPKFYHAIKPGITSYWACNGRNDKEYKKRLELEYFYIRNCTFFLDCKVVIKTIYTLLVERNGK